MSNEHLIAMRALSLNAIKKAKQGHTGMAMSAAPLTYTLFTKFINIKKDNPKWINRDRFVLSAGHGSLSIYSILHFAGILSIDDIKNHKQEGSKTPGHPEYEVDNYIDASTGPLGQGVAMSVGMAIAEVHLSSIFGNLKGLIDHYTYCLVGDGCLQEGISYESMSLAGKLKLNKLIVIHDSNDYQIDGNVNKTFIENLELRFKSMDWNYISSSNDCNEITLSIEKAKNSNKPTFIEVKTIIGEGTTAANSEKAHGLKVDDKEEEYFSTINNYTIEEFQFNDSIYKFFRENVIERGDIAYKKWIKIYQEYKSKFSQEIKKFDEYCKGNFPNISDVITHKKILSNNRATREYVKEYLEQISHNILTDWFLIGSADLASPTNVKIDLENDFSKNYSNCDIFYGIREFAMAAIQNGILLHHGLKTIDSTFLVFSDYMKPALRLGAMQKLPSIHIFSHDSYLVGGDGPTHQPYDQLPMLRAIANTYVYRPCDEVETEWVFNKMFSSKSNVQIGVFTRQPTLSHGFSSVEKAQFGGYIFSEDSDAWITLVGGGSEIDILIDLKNKLNNIGIKVKIVSVPCLQLFIKNSESYLKNILYSKNSLLTIESSSDYMWYELHKYAKNSIHFGAYTFGESMDGNILYGKKGFDSLKLMNILKANKMI
ncbi:MAG: transketolase [Mycoplasmoidaceae bacterium]